MNNGIPAWLRPVDDDGWYGTVDHRRYENTIEQAREATWQDDLDLADPPAGTFIPGLGEV